MKKSIYSLVLMDKLVEKVDQLAYTNNTSRSNMVNQILAEYLSLITPEKRMQDIFMRMEQLISTCHGLQTTINTSDRAMSIKSVLSYKYNPTVRYSLVLYPTAGRTFGELRVLFRTQNLSLIDTLTQFFVFWAKLESSARPGDNIAHRLGDGKLTRELITIPGASNEQLGEASVRYIELFDRALKSFFEYRESPNTAMREVQSLYNNYLRNETLFI